MTVIELDDAGDLDEIDPGAKIERSGNLRAGNDQHIEPLETFHQGMGDGPAPAQMAKPERIVAVHENAGLFQPVNHGCGLLN